MNPRPPHPALREVTNTGATRQPFRVSQKWLSVAQAHNVPTRRVLVHTTRRPPDIDPIAAFSALDDTTRANIIGTIVGHPKGAPSKKEIEYYNPSVAASTLTDHLTRLAEVGLIEVMERDRDGLERGQPYRFFQLTEAARELFDRNNLYDPDAYRALFAEVEKSVDVADAEAVDRPAEGR